MELDGVAQSCTELHGVGLVGLVRLDSLWNCAGVNIGVHWSCIGLLTQLCVRCSVSCHIILLNHIFIHYSITLLNFLFFTLLGLI